MKVKSIRKTLLLSLPTLFVCSSAVVARADSRPNVWIAPSLTRVGMSDAPGGETHVNLSAAKGGDESFQIVTQGSSSGLRVTDVTLSDLTGPGGQVISKKQFTLYR